MVAPAAKVSVAVCGTKPVENSVSVTIPGATVVAKRVGKNFAIRAVHANAGIFQRTVGGLVLDPYCGVASTGVAALIEKRRFLGAELVDEYVEIAIDRLRQVSSGTALYRSADQEIHVPNPTDKVARRPDGFSQVADRLLQIN